MIYLGSGEMKQDKIYCKNCKRISVDIYDCKEQDTRFGFKALCPYCLSTNTVNANLIKLQYEEYNRRGYSNLGNDNDEYYRNLDQLYRNIQKALLIFKQFPKSLNSLENKIDRGD